MRGQKEGEAQVGKNTKIACIHITHDDIRLAEGRVSNGVILLSRTAIIQKADRFFHGERLAFMSDMVAAIVNAMTMNSFTAKDLYIVYDNNLQVDFFLDEKLLVKKDTRSFSFGKKKSEREGAAVKNAGVIVHKKEWGKFITEMDKGQLYTTVSIERDLVDFMLSEFQEHGYHVVSIEPPETALLYLRKMVPYTYDALNKLVLYAKNDTTGYFYQFTKDAPSGGHKQVFFEASEAGDFVGRVVNVIEDEINKNGLHNPHIMLVGDAFADQNVYIECCREIRDHGLCSIDLYALWRDRSLPLNCVRVILPDEDMEITRDGRFGLCMALMARVYEPKPENLVEGFRITGVGKKTKSAMMEFALTAASLFLVFSIMTTALSGYENYVAQQEFDRATDATESRLALAKQKRDTAKAKLDALGTIDRRYNEIFRFVYAQVNEDLNIASIDTEDMIPVTDSSGSTYSTPNATNPNQAVSDPSAAAGTGDVVDVTGDSAFANYEMKVIVIRGYSRTTEGPVELYKALVNADIGEVKVVGVEQVPLPSQETMFAFEMTVGINEGGGF